MFFFLLLIHFRLFKNVIFKLEVKFESCNVVRSLNWVKFQIFGNNGKCFIWFIFLICSLWGVLSTSSLLKNQNNNVKRRNVAKSLNYEKIPIYLTTINFLWNLLPLKYCKFITAQSPLEIAIYRSSRMRRCQIAKSKEHTDIWQQWKVISLILPSHSLSLKMSVQGRSMSTVNNALLPNRWIRWKFRHLATMVDTVLEFFLKFAPIEMLHRCKSTIFIWSCYFVAKLRGWIFCGHLATMSVTLIQFFSNSTLFWLRIYFIVPTLPN